MIIAYFLLSWWNHKEIEWIDAILCEPLHLGITSFSHFSVSGWTIGISKIASILLEISLLACSTEENGLNGGCHWFPPVSLT